ncbi:hypothetical protein JXJ21_10350 [candidate division KSB1 bacterium]|nr:hypothetical protein [candidate division KSB1 bacterium]
MFRNLITLFGAVFLILALILGCSDDNPTEPEEEKMPEFEVKAIYIPSQMAQSQDPHAQQTVAYINMANGIAGFASFFTPPANTSLAKTAGTTGDLTWTRTWKVDSLTITLNVSKQNDLIVWDVIVSGSDQGVIHQNWKMLHAEKTINAQSGSLIFYQLNSTEKATEWLWNIDDEDVYTLTMIFYEGEGGKIEIIQNPDKSGELLIYKNSANGYALEFKAQWQANGSGEWWLYDANGEITDHNNWG